MHIDILSDERHSALAAPIGITVHTFSDLRAATIFSAFALRHVLPYFLLRLRAMSLAVMDFFFFMLQSSHRPEHAQVAG
jgi:hypothetical protein